MFDPAEEAFMTLVIEYVKRHIAEFEAAFGNPDAPEHKLALHLHRTRGRQWSLSENDFTHILTPPRMFHDGDGTHELPKELCRRLEAEGYKAILSMKCDRQGYDINNIDVIWKEPEKPKHYRVKSFKQLVADSDDYSVRGGDRGITLYRNDSPAGEICQEHLAWCGLAVTKDESGMFVGHGYIWPTWTIEEDPDV